MSAHHPASIEGTLIEPIQDATGWRPASWNVYDDIRAERYRAHMKHRAKPGGSMEMHRWDSSDWLPVVGEEYGEVCRAHCDHVHGVIADRESFARHLREELVQTAAMCAAWIDAIDREYDPEATLSDGEPS